MMVEIDDEGCVVRSWEAGEAGAPEGLIELSDWVSPNMVYWSDTYQRWIERPDCPFEEVPEGIDIAVPDGSEVLIYDVEADHLLATLLPDEENMVEVRLPDPGVYRLCIEASRPYRNSELHVEVPE